MTPKAFLKLVLPPFVSNACRAIWRDARPSGRRLVYAPLGWETKLPEGAAPGYESTGAISLEQNAWNPFIRSLKNSHSRLVTDRSDNPDPWRLACDHNAFMTFGYVLALSAHGKGAVKVLDYGGALGPFYYVARALMPDVLLEYHCKELPGVARAGRDASPKIIWHTDDSCFEQQYDLIMFSGSLQYIRNWREILRQAARATRAYMYVTSAPVVERVAGYVAVQRHAGALMLHQQFNKADLLEAFDATGLRLKREFWIEDHPHIVDAPEQPTYFGCLLKIDV